MKARLVRIKEREPKEGYTYKLLLCTGNVKKMTEDTILTFLASFDSSEHYSGNRIWDHKVTMEEYGPGETAFYVDDEFHLVFCDTDFLKKILFEHDQTYITATEYADVHEKKRSIVVRHCKEGRIPGAFLLGRVWVIPANAPYPDDMRIKK